MRVLEDSGLAYPLTVLPGNACPDAATDKWLIKPLRGSAGLGVRVAAASDVGVVPRGHCWQRQIEGQACSAVFVAAGGRAKLVGASRQLIGQDWNLSRPFLYVGAIGPLELSAGEQEKLARLGNVLAGEFRLVGLFNVDFVRTTSELWTVEVNPRYSASVEVLERATGANFLAWHVAACEADQLPAEAPQPQPRIFAGKAVVYAHTDGQALPALTRLVNEWNQPGNWPGIADIPASGQPISAGQPVVTVFASGSTAEQVEQQLRQRAESVQAAISSR